MSAAFRPTEQVESAAETTGGKKSLGLAVQLSESAHEKRNKNRKGKPFEPLAVVFMISPI